MEWNDKQGFYCNDSKLPVSPNLKARDPTNRNDDRASTRRELPCAAVESHVIRYLTYLTQPRASKMASCSERCYTLRRGGWSSLQLKATINQGLTGFAGCVLLLFIFAKHGSAMPPWLAPAESPGISRDLMITMRIFISIPSRIIVSHLYDLPLSVSNAIVMSSCSPGYSGRSRHTNDFVASPSPLGSANFASTNLT